MIHQRHCLRFLILVLNYLLLLEARHHLHHGWRKNPENKNAVPAPSPSPDEEGDDPPPPAPAPAPAPDIINSSSCIFDVTSFGAVGDGATDDTAAFRSAWKAACQVQNAVVLAPSPLVFLITSTIFSGPCQPGLVFQVDGVIMPPDGPDCWPKSDSRRQWLVFYRLDEMSLTGTGTIEGNGHQWWDLPCKPHKGPNGSTLPGPCDSPALIRFFMSSNLVVSGLRIQNSPQFHIKFDGCQIVLIHRLSISSPKFSPNTDGIHIENTKSVGIYDSVIANGMLMD